MTPKEFKAYAKVMREFSVESLTLEGVHIKLAQALPAEQTNKPHKQAAPIPLDAPIAESDPVKHSVENLTSIMKLSDVDLVDALFPDHTEQESA